MSHVAFLDEYQKFCQHPALNGMEDPDKIALFNVYCTHRRTTQNRQPSSNPPSKAPATRSHLISERQMQLIQELIRDGNLARDTKFQNITKQAASSLIEQGIQRAKDRKTRHEPVEQDADENEEFTGSFNTAAHDSDDLPF